MAYRRIELLPDERIELLLATIAALIANQWRGEHDAPTTPRDFMPWLQDEEDEAQEGAELAMIDVLTTVFGARRVDVSDGDSS